MITVEKVMPQGEDIGFVGKITHVDTTLINTLLDQGYTPIVSTIGLDEKYHAYYIIADDVDSAIARAVKASKLVFLTDIEGVLEDPNNPETLISKIDTESAKELFENELMKKTDVYKNDNIVYLNPNIWYTATGGFTSTMIMVEEIDNAIK